MNDREIAKQAITHDIRSAIVRARLVAESGLMPIITSKIYHEQLFDVLELPVEELRKESVRLLVDDLNEKEEYKAWKDTSDPSEDLRKTIDSIREIMQKPHIAIVMKELLDEQNR